MYDTIDVIFYYAICITHSLHVVVFFYLRCINILLLGYEPADLTVHPPPPKTIEGGVIFSHRCLVPPKFFPQRKSGFCRRY